MSLMSMFPGGGGTNNQPLKAPSNLKVLMNNTTSVQITWTDPENEYSQPSGALIGEWMFTRIVRKIGSAPVNANDGELIVESAVKNQYQSTPFIDSNSIVLGTTYYYAAFAFTKSRVSSPAAVFMIKAAYYDPVLENNTWSAIYNALVEGVASSIWSKGDTKTENGVVYSLEAFNPTMYPLSDGSGYPLALFVTKSVIGNNNQKYTNKMNDLSNKSDMQGDRTYATSRLKTVIGSNYYNQMGNEIKQYIPKVNVRLWGYAEDTSIGYEPPDVLETYQEYLFPLGETALPHIFPTATSRAKGGIWWTGDVAAGDRRNIGAPYYNIDYGTAATVNEDGTLSDHTTDYQSNRQDNRRNIVFGFCFGKAGA